MPRSAKSSACAAICSAAISSSSTGCLRTSTPGRCASERSTTSSTSRCTRRASRSARAIAACSSLHDAVLQRLEAPDHADHRVAELVRDVRAGRAPQLVLAPQRGRQAVERLRELARLAIAAPTRRARLDLAVDHPARHAGHVLERRGDPERDEEAEQQRDRRRHDRALQQALVQLARQRASRRWPVGPRRRAGSRRPGARRSPCRPARPSTDHGARRLSGWTCARRARQLPPARVAAARRRGPRPPRARSGRRRRARPRARLAGS